MTRIGIVGIGFMGMVHYLTYQRIPGAQVVALCDRNGHRCAGDWTDIRGNFGPPGKQMDLAGVEVYESPEDLLSDAAVDLVDICLPPAAHADIALQALAARKHVLCEKPMALTLADCDRMLEAARFHDRQLLIAHVLPCFPEYAWALREIRSGEYGALLGGEFTRIIAEPDWLAHYWREDVMGGPLLDLHVHDAHFIRLALGMPTKVTTRGSLRDGLPEYWNTLFEFESPQLSARATSGVVSQQSRPFLHGFHIRLEQATLAFEFAVERPAGEKPSAGYLCRPTRYDESGAHQVELGDGDPMRAFHTELSLALRVVRGETMPDMLDAQLARDAMAICCWQTESLRQSFH